MDDSLTGTRILSARRSKPDMAALVDQHRTMATHTPVRRSDILLEDRVPAVNIESVNSDDSVSSTYSIESQSFVIRKRVSHRPKRLPKLRLKTVANGSSTSGPHNSRILSLHSNLENENNLDPPTMTVVIAEGSDDADDNIPLSSFIPPKSTTPDPPPAQPSDPRKPDSSVVLCQCTRPAVLDDPRWDGQYCSPECLISVCHRAFEFWLHMHRKRSGISSC